MASKGMIIKRILKETDKWTIEELLYWRLKDLERYLKYLKFKNINKETRKKKYV